MSVSQSRTPTDQTSLSGVASPPVEALWRDVRERPGYVPDRGQRVRSVELCEAEVEELRRELVAVLDEDVRRLHVAMDDPRPVRVCERVQHLRRDLDGIAVGERAGPDRLAQGPSRHVFVRDVDVARS